MCMHYIHIHIYTYGLASSAARTAMVTPTRDADFRHPTQYVRRLWVTKAVASGAVAAVMANATSLATDLRA